MKMASLREFAKRRSNLLAWRMGGFAFLSITLAATWLFVASFRTRVHSSMSGAISDMSNLFELGDTLQLQHQVTSLVANQVFDGAELVVGSRRIASATTGHFSFEDIRKSRSGLHLGTRGIFWIERRPLPSRLGSVTGVFTGVVRIPLRGLALFWGVLTAIFFAFVFFVKRAYDRFAHEMADSIVRVDDYLTRFDPSQPHPYPTQRERFYEVERILDRFRDFANRISLFEKEASEAKRKDALVQLARQVAHDIRSPLAALNLIAADASELPEAKRGLVQSATTRIHTIANDLLKENYRLENTAATPRSLSEHHLLTLLTRLIAEKRAEWAEFPRTNLDLEVSGEGYPLFAPIEESEFQRMISNLLNNSKQALSERKGAITVSLNRHQGFALLEIRDNGKGMSGALVAELLGDGRPFGRTEGGFGLGLPHARRTISEWGGRLEIESEEGIGTRIKLFIPLSSAPDWFPRKLSMQATGDLIVIDDEPTIHEVWRSIVSGRVREDERPRLTSFFSVREARHHLFSKEIDLSYATILCDFEFRGESESGLSLLRDLPAAFTRYLVTGRAHERPIRSGCTESQLPLLSKELVQWIPFNLLPSLREASTRPVLHDPVSC